VRADVGAAELTSGRRRCCARVGEERRGASEKRGASGTGAVRRGGDDNVGACWRYIFVLKLK
jgi:hypothetical protein